jgi:ribose 5-phosphate isomerase A
LPANTQETKEQLDREKQVVARAAVRWVRGGMRLALGSGSTAHYFIEFLGERVREGGLKIEAIATSRESEAQARQAGISIIQPERGLRLDLDVDGADEIAPDLSLIKGRGGALLREKVLARASRYFLVIADSSKRVETLGAMPVPVEVVPFARPWVADEIQKLGGKPVLRVDVKAPEKTYLTDQQNCILDCQFGPIENPPALAEKLEKIPGIAGHGLFLGYASAALVANGENVFALRSGEIPVPLEKFDIAGDYDSRSNV